MILWKGTYQQTSRFQKVKLSNTDKQVERDEELTSYQPVPLMLMEAGQRIFITADEIHTIYSS